MAARPSSTALLITITVAALFTVLRAHPSVAAPTHQQGLPNNAGASQQVSQASAAPQTQPSQQPMRQEIQPSVPASDNKFHVPTVQETNDAFVAQIKVWLKGREQEPAGKVFKNVHRLAEVPAANLLSIMNGGYSRALGVTCTHCHNENDFSSDEKRPKRAAREMQVMHRSINEQLQKMENLVPRPDHFINCATCHRGMVDPRQPIPPK